MFRGLRYPALAVMFSACLLAGEHILLHAGKLLPCTVDEPSFSSATAEIGEPLLCHAGPLSEFGRSIFPRGSHFAGRLVDYRKPGRLAGKGWIKLEFDRLILPDAEVSLATKVVAVQRFKVDAGGRILGRGHAVRDAVGWSIPILWPMKLITLPGRGPRTTLQGEVHMVLRLLDDAQIPQHDRKDDFSELIPRTTRFRVPTSGRVSRTLGAFDTETQPEPPSVRPVRQGR